MTNRNKAKKKNINLYQAKTSVIKQRTGLIPRKLAVNLELLIVVFSLHLDFLYTVHQLPFYNKTKHFYFLIVTHLIRPINSLYASVPILNSRILFSFALRR